MKMMKLVYPMTLALAVTLAATGCRNHRPYGVTPIPNGQGGRLVNTGRRWHAWAAISPAAASRRI